MSDDSHREKVFELIRSRRFGALAVQDPSGHPYVASTAYLPLGDSADLLLFLSELSDHRKAIENDPHVSMLIEAPDVPPEKRLASPRVTLIGEVEKRERTEDLRAMWLSRHPEAELWVDFSDFAFFQLRTKKARFIEGFGSMERLSF
jgi:putative heme iron utilization protein